MEVVDPCDMVQEEAHASTSQVMECYEVHAWHIEELAPSLNFLSEWQLQDPTPK